jgi:hypothetical protein
MQLIHRSIRMFYRYIRMFPLTPKSLLQRLLPWLLFISDTVLYMSIFRLSWIYLLIDLLFNLSTHNGRWPSQSRIISSRMPSFECFNPFVSFCLAHATIDMPNSTSSTNLTGSHSPHPQELYYTLLFFITTFCQWGTHVVCVKWRKEKIRVIDRPVRLGVWCWQCYFWGEPSVHLLLFVPGLWALNC